MRMETFVWWMGLMSTVAEWSSVMMESGVLCVMMTGKMKMQELCAGNLDCQHLVRYIHV